MLCTLTTQWIYFCCLYLRSPILARGNLFFSVPVGQTLHLSLAWISSPVFILWCWRWDRGSQAYKVCAPPQGTSPAVEFPPSPTSWLHISWTCLPLVGPVLDIYLFLPFASGDLREEALCSPLMGVRLSSECVLRDGDLKATGGLVFVRIFPVVWISTKAVPTWCRSLFG